MRIGLDIDDTISNTHFVLMKYAYLYNKEHGNKPLLQYNTNDFSKVFGWNDEEVNAFFRTYYLDALKELEPKCHAKEVLTALRNQGHEIVFITIRNDRECGGEGEARRLTEEWLKKYGIPYDELYTAVFDKKECCKQNKIDVFMDDSIKNCKAVSELGIKTFMAMNCFNLELNDESITNIYRLDELYEQVIRLSPKHSSEKNLEER